jgi:hypothetical protein
MKKLFSSLLLVIALLTAGGAAAQGNAGNIQGTLLPLLARTAATVNTSDQQNYLWRCVSVLINVTAFVAGTYTPTIQGKDPVSGNYYTILTGAAMASAIQQPTLRVCPGITPVANVAVSDILPRTWRVTFAGATGQSMTFSVGVFLNQ